MKRIIFILAIVLIVQISLVVANQFLKNESKSNHNKLPLVEFTVDDVTRLELSDQTENLTLAVKNDQWVIPDLQDFPADNDKVLNFLQNISALKKGWPVAKTVSSAKRYNVDDENFERRVVIKNEEKVLEELFVGDSPSFRKTYARNMSDPQTYSVDFSAYEASLKPSDWIDNEILFVDEITVESIRIDDIEILRDANSWTLVGLSDEQMTNEQKLTNMIKGILELRFDEVLQSNEEEKNRSNLKTINIGRKNGDDIIYEFWPDGDDFQSASQFYFRTSENSQIFKVSKYKIRNLLEIKLGDLISEKQVDETQIEE